MSPDVQMSPVDKINYGEKVQYPFAIPLVIAKLKKNFFQFYRLCLQSDIEEVLKMFRKKAYLVAKVQRVFSRTIFYRKQNTKKK